MPPWGPLLVGLLALAVVPVWGVYGALRPPEDHGGMGVETGEFVAQAQAYAREHRLEDGSVRGVPDREIPIVVRQFGFEPGVLRLRTGERYTLAFVSSDVMHGFSLQMGVGSINAVIEPGMMVMQEITPMQPGTYLFLCNEYCGIGHQLMSGTIVVEGEPVERNREPSKGDQEQMPGMSH